MRFPRCSIVIHEEFGEMRIALNPDFAFFGLGGLVRRRRRLREKSLDDSQDPIHDRVQGQGHPTTYEIRILYVRWMVYTS